MAYVKNHCTKLVFFLFCLSLQVQGESDMVFKESDPYNKLFWEVFNFTDMILGMLRNRLIESGVPIDKLENIYQEYTQESVIWNKIKKIEMEISARIHPDFFSRLVEDLGFENSEIGKKIKELNEELKELYDGTMNSILERYYEVKELQVINRTKPIVKRLIPIVKEVNELVFHIISEKNKEIKKN